MKKITAIAFLFIALSLQISAQGGGKKGGESTQSFSNTMLKMGFMYEYFNLTPTDSGYQAALKSSNGTSTLIIPYYNLLIAGYYPLAHKNDIISAGVDAGVQIGLNFQSGVSYQLQVPLFAMGRIGAGATNYNEQKLGLGLGIGGQFSFLNERRSVLGSDRAPKKIVGFSPSGLIELSIRQGGGRLMGRFHFPLIPFKTKIPGFDIYDSQNNAIYKTDYWQVNNFGLGLIYSL